MAKNTFNIPKQKFPTSVADAYNGLLGVKNQQVNIPISLLDEIENQPFPINESKVEQIAESIENVGVIEAIIVVKNGERYSILSGRHRFRACKKLGKEEIPCIVKDLSADDPTARYILIATNTDRNNEYAPTVYARAYAEQLELMKQLGKKATVSTIAENNHLSRKQIYRYIRLVYLIKELQEWVDNSVISIEAAVELSFISETKQFALYNHIVNLGIEDNILKVNTTKKIHNIADTLSDEEFTANIDKIVFGNYEEKIVDSVPEPMEQKPADTEPGVKVLVDEATDNESKSKEKVTISEPTVKITEKNSVPDSKVGLEVPLAVPVEEYNETDKKDNTPDTETTLNPMLTSQSNYTPRFKNKNHETNYHIILDMMKKTDLERKVLAYLFALDTVCFEHIRDLYDFADNGIELSGLDKGWHTGTSRRTTRLAFNLYNGYCSDGETYIGSDGFEENLPSSFYSPVNLFCCEYAPYYVEALKMRFPEYFK